MARTTGKGMRSLPGQLQLVMSDAQEAASLIEYDVIGAFDAIIREATHGKRRAAASHTHIARSWKRAEIASVEFGTVAA